MTDPVVIVTEEVNGVTIQLSKDVHVGFPTPCQLTHQFRSYPLEICPPPSAPVRPSAYSRAGPPPSACPPTVRPRPLVSLAYLPLSAHLPVRLSAWSPPPSLRPLACPSARLPVLPPVCLSICPLLRGSPRPAPSASFHPWSLAYKLLVVEVEHALFV